MSDFTTHDVIHVTIQRRYFYHGGGLLRISVQDSNGHEHDITLFASEKFRPRSIPVEWLTTRREDQDGFWHNDTAESPPLEGSER